MKNRDRGERPVAGSGCAESRRGDGALGDHRPGRRSFLKLLGIGGAMAVVPAAPALGAQTSHGEKLARKHAGDPSLLIDVSKCIGCGSCVTACKLRKGLPWRDDQPAVGAGAALASTNLTVVKAFEARKGGKTTTRFVKNQCLHCMEPACVAACFAKALKKSPKGPVVYDASMCVGCRYCMLACPFHALSYEWDDVVKPRVKKCNLCEDLTSKGQQTSCAEACPTGAISYGTREAMLAQAHSAIAADPGKYQPEVYGEKEAGGTSVLYISDVPFEKLGFRQNAPEEPIPEYAELLSKPVPFVALAVAGALTAVQVRRGRRETAEGGTPE